MRHAKNTCKLGRTGAHKRALMANMLRALIEHGKIETTIPKAKELRRHADRMITLAKKNTLASKKQASAKLMLHYNSLSPKEAKKVKKGDTTPYNGDRKVLAKLFGEWREKFDARKGGYTRIVKSDFRIGDSAPRCVIEYL